MPTKDESTRAENEPVACCDHDPHIHAADGCHGPECDCKHNAQSSAAAQGKADQLR